MKPKIKSEPRRRPTDDTMSRVVVSQSSNPVDTLQRWNAKVALVTGASSGIGAAIAEALAEAGMKVAITGRDRARLQSVASRIRDCGGGRGNVLALRCDHTLMSENARIFRALRKRWNGVDVLVNCAGIRGALSLLDSEWPELQVALDLNVSASLWCAREAVSQMRGKAEGAIVNISSMVGHRVLPGAPAMYSATKHALRILTDGLRSEVAKRGLPIKVSLISPGLTDTAWHRQSGGVHAGGKKYPHVPLRPRDVAEAVCHILATRPGVQVRDLLLSPNEQPY